MSKRTAPQFYDTATLIHDIVDTLSLSRIDIQVYVHVYLCVVREKAGQNDKSLRIIAQIREFFGRNFDRSFCSF